MRGGEAQLHEERQERPRGHGRSGLGGDELSEPQNDGGFLQELPDPGQPGTPDRRQDDRMGGLSGGVRAACPSP